jgi:hypothetical protein
MSPHSGIKAFYSGESAAAADDEAELREQAVAAAAAAEAEAAALSVAAAPPERSSNGGRNSSSSAFEVLQFQPPQPEPQVRARTFSKCLCMHGAVGCLMRCLCLRRNSSSGASSVSP